MLLSYIVITGWVRSARARLASDGADDAGEGIISAAIVVLIMAFLGVAMWILFSRVFNDAGEGIEDQINRIGSTTSP